MARILVVDDEPDVLELFNITLKMVGHVTETARDGVEAVEKVKASMPDLILLDLMMPHLDGFGFLAHVRKEYEQKPVRVLVATAKILEEVDQEKLNAWPVVGVLNKGELDIGQMVGVVSTALVQNPFKDGPARPEDRQELPQGAIEHIAAPEAKQQPAIEAEAGAAAAPVGAEKVVEKKPEATVESKPEAKPETLPLAEKKPEAALEGKPEAKPQALPLPLADKKPEAVAESKPEAKPEALAEEAKKAPPASSRLKPKPETGKLTGARSDEKPSAS